MSGNFAFLMAACSERERVARCHELRVRPT
jgi:hypothetical protein